MSRARLPDRCMSDDDVSPFRIVLCQIHENGNAPHALGLSRAHHERPSRRCTAHKTDKFPPPHSITSSAVDSRDGGTVRPSIRAVSALMTISNLLVCNTGRSSGLAPLRTRPV